MNPLSLVGAIDVGCTDVCCTDGEGDEVGANVGQKLHFTGQWNANFHLSQRLSESPSTSVQYLSTRFMAIG